MIHEIFEKWNRIIVEIVSRSQSTSSDSRSMLSRDKRLPIENGMQPDYRKMFLGIKYSPLYDTKRSGSVPQAVGTGTSFARDEERMKDTIPMPTFARRPSTMSSSIPVEFQQNSMVGPQRQQISELQFDKFPTPSTFLFWKNISKF